MFNGIGPGNINNKPSFLDNGSLYSTSSSKSNPLPPGERALLLEDSGFFLLESGGILLLE